MFGLGNHKQRVLRREQIANTLWIWIGTINLSRDAPREMIGSQNLSKIPDWLLPRLYSLADILEEHVYTFERDQDFEYRFKPSPSQIPSIRCDVYKRIRHWKKIVRKLEKEEKKNKHKR